MAFSFWIKDASDRLYWQFILVFSAKSKDLELSPYLHMENNCELFYIFLFQLLKYMEIKIWFKCSFYKDCQNILLLEKDRWHHREGRIDLFVLFFLVQYACCYILCLWQCSAAQEICTERFFVCLFSISFPPYVTLPACFRSVTIRGVTCSNHVPGYDRLHPLCYGTSHHQSGSKDGVCLHLLPTQKKGMSKQCSDFWGDWKDNSKVEKAKSNIRH